MGQLEACMLKKSTLLMSREALAPKSSLLHRKETRGQEDISRDHPHVDRIRDDKFCIGAEFVLDQEGFGQ